MSSENTSRKVETGGFLAGHEFENHYVLTDNPTPPTIQDLRHFNY